MTLNQPVNEVRPITLDGREYIVQALQIASTDVVVFSAWEEGTFTSHTSVTTIDGRTYGKVYTRMLFPQELAAMPYNEARADAVRAYHDELRAEAERAIAAAFPELRDRSRFQEGNADCFAWELA